MMATFHHPKGGTPLTFTMSNLHGWITPTERCRIKDHFDIHDSFKLFVKCTYDETCCFKHARDVFVIPFEPSTDKRLNKSLITASHDGNTRDVKTLLEKGADVDGIPFGLSKRRTALHSAHNVEIARMLLNAGGDPDMELPSIPGATPVTAMGSIGNFMVLELLLKAGGNPNVYAYTTLGNYGSPLTHKVIQLWIQTNFEKYIDCLKLLLDAGADPNAMVGCKRAKQTLLHEAYLFGDNRVIRMLISAGANPNSVNIMNRTPKEAYRQQAPYSRHDVINDIFESPESSDNATPDPSYNATPDPSDNATPESSDNATPEPSDNATPEPSDNATHDEKTKLLSRVTSVMLMSTMKLLRFGCDQINPSLESLMTGFEC